MPKDFRSEFEKWVCFVHERKLPRSGDGYLDPNIDYAWQAWKAALSVPISPELAAKALRSIKSESRAKASRENGQKVRKYPPCTRYPKQHHFWNDRCPCGYERKSQ